MGKPLTHGRNFTEFLNRYGVTEGARAEAVEIAAGLAPVVIVDDARHLVRPLTVRAAQYYAFEGAAAGLYSACQISATGNGCYITSIWNANSAIGVLGEPANPVLTPTGGVTTPQVVEGLGAPLATVQTGTLAAAPPNGWLTIAVNQPYPACPFYLAPGEMLTVMRTTLNNLFIANFVIQEIP